MAKCGSSPRPRKETSAVLKCSDATRDVARVVTRGIKAGRVVEIDGLGVFYPDAKTGLRFVP